MEGKVKIYIHREEWGWTVYKTGTALMDELCEKT